MRTLSSNLYNALAGPVQQPALLVEIGFSTPWRATTGATLSWNGQTWARHDIEVAGLRVEALRVSGTVVVGNTVSGIGAMLLNEGAVDRSVRIWAYDAGATSLADVVPLCAEAVGASYELDPQTNEARITLRHRCEHVLGPRTFLTPETFGPMLPAGGALRINGIDLVLDRR
jgi:hypothetical protein